MKKPNFLKSRREKQIDRIVGLTASTAELVVALNEKKERDELKELQKESQKLKNENMELKNELLRLQAEREKRESK